MLKNLLTVAVRNFLRQKFYSIINVVGLASGLTCALFIYLWVSDEVSKDKFHKDSEKIFQILSNINLGTGELLTWTNTPGPLAEDIREKNPEVELVVRVMSNRSDLFQYEDKSFIETGCLADPDFFKLFSFNILSGKPNTDTADISSISISHQLAQKLFGNDDPIGKMVKVNNQIDYAIAAVFEDVGSKSSMKFDYVIPFEVYKKQRGQGFNWGNYDHPTYVKLFDASQAQQAIDKINERRMVFAKAQGNTSSGASFYMQPFTENYLNSHFENGKPVGGRIKYVRIFAVVAIFILVIACINFMNMATARAVNRAKEVGVRKVVGAQRKSLILQFIGEAILISLFSMTLALLITYVLLPFFNILVAKQIVISLSDTMFWASAVVIVLITGILAGTYPAFFLSSYQPAQALKRAASSKGGSGSLRKALVVFQFTLTVVLVASSLVIYNQIQFIFNKSIGYNRESVLSFPLRGSLRNEYDAFKNEALQYPGITTISKADNSLVQVNNQNASVSWPGKSATESIFFRTVCVDYDYLETMGLEVIQGRSFKKEYSDTNTFVVSKRAAEIMGLEEPIGTEITQWGTKGRIIGIVNDFHSRSMHEAIDPIVFMFRPQWTARAFIKFEGTKTQEVLQSLEKVYGKYNPQYPFTYSFIDDDFEKLYNNERVISSLALSFTIMAIIISGLGLLGLAAYTAERKRKEISIRKTMGASVGDIVTMMSADFVKLSIIAAVIGCPTAWYLMTKFLEGYTYHTELGWGLFVLTAVCVLIISLITVIFQVAKAAVAKPIDALRNE
jgi:ABC-type antimicrobial peptide transport system permease subunit